MQIRLRTSLLAAVLLGLGALQPPALAAQTILNVERLQPRDVLGWHASVEGSASLSGGNSGITDVTAGFVVGHRWEPHWIRLLTGVEYIGEEGSSTKNNRFAHLRYSYEITDRWRTFHFVQAQRSQTLLLRERTLLGSGIRRTFYRTERTQFDAGTGAMYERERLDAEQIDPGQEVATRVWRMANLFVATRQFREDLRLLGVAYLQPDLTELADYRLLTDLSLFVGLGPHVDLALRFEWRHDSRPPAPLEPDDYLFETGIVLSIR